jgi:hypothetical protein
MRKTLLAGLAALAIGGAGADLVIRAALAEPPPPPADDAQPPAEHDGGPMGRHGWMGWHHRFMHHGGPFHAFSLFYHPADRALSSDDVQKIASALLLWNGNHSWKVGDVTENPDNTVSFAYTASDGTPIAKFSMDRKTGHIQRIG